MAMRKPVLGVCRGAQIINVALGGTLYQDIATQLPDALNHRNWAIYEQNCHATSIVAGSGLARLYPGADAREDEFDPSPGGEGPRAAISSSRHWSEPDRIVEAIRWTGPRLRLRACNGTPNSTRPDDPSFVDDTPILDEFLAAAAQHKSAAYAI